MTKEEGLPNFCSTSFQVFWCCETFSMKAETIDLVVFSHFSLKDEQEKQWLLSSSFQLLTISSDILNTILKMWVPCKSFWPKSWNKNWNFFPFPDATNITKKKRHLRLHLHCWLVQRYSFSWPLCLIAHFEFANWRGNPSCEITQTFNCCQWV